MKKNDYYKYQGQWWLKNKPKESLSRAWVNENKVGFHHSDVRWFNVHGFMIGNVGLNEFGKIIGDE